MAGDTEREDFERAIREGGFAISDFARVPHEDSIVGLTPQEVTGTMTITRESNGRQKVYRAGHGSHWPAEFDQDLSSGFFGEP